MVAICLGLGVLAAVLFSRRLPYYRGQSLEFWFHNLPSVTIPAPGATRIYKNAVFPATWPQEPSEKNAREALQAVRAVGTNALPFLMRKLKGRDPRAAFGGTLGSHLKKLPDIPWLLPAPQRVSVERQQAVTGLLALCPLPPDAVRKLRKITDDLRNPNCATGYDILRANDNPKLRDEVLNSCLQDIAQREQLKAAAKSGRLEGGGISSKMNAEPEFTELPQDARLRYGEPSKPTPAIRPPEVQKKIDDQSRKFEEDMKRLFPDQYQPK